MSYFPMYVDLAGKDCLVIGGGRVAAHKVAILLDFGALVTVVAPEIFFPKETAADITICQRCWQESDLDNRFLVIVATDSFEENRKISLLCRERGIPVNAVDQPEDCSFIFGAYVKCGEVIASFSSGGSSPVITQYLKEKIRPHMTEPLGEAAEELRRRRAEIKQNYPPEQRKEIYRNILWNYLSQGDSSTEGSKC